MLVLLFKVTLKLTLGTKITKEKVVRPTLELFVRVRSNSGVERGRSAPNLATERAAVAALANERGKPHRRLHPRRIRSPPGPGASAKSDPSFVFPDQVSVSASPPPARFLVPNTTEPPPCARGDTFCESVDEYPAEHVIRLLREEPILLRGFFQDERKHYVDDLQDRIDASDESPLCISQEQIVYPQMAKNIDGNWLFVINQDEYKQGVRVEKCVNNRECSFSASLPLGYYSQCKQKYIYRKLVALNGTGKGVISDFFPLPSCCSCVIKLDRAHGAHNRFAGHSDAALSALPLTLPKTTTTTTSTTAPARARN